MSELELLENIGTAAVKRLRHHKLSSGKPFMINSDDLPSGQSYLEYPDGVIRVVKVSTGSHSFTILKKMNPMEAQAIRIRYELF